MVVRDTWLEDEKNEVKRAEMMETGFPCYCNHDGLFADFPAWGISSSRALEWWGSLVRKWPKSSPGTVTSG